MKGWGFTVSLFNGTGWLIPVIAIAALFFTTIWVLYDENGLRKTVMRNVPVYIYPQLVSKRD